MLSLWHAGRETVVPGEPWGDPLLTSLWHTLRPLHSGVQHLFGGHEEDVVGRLLTVHHLQLFHQEVHAAIRVLLPYLT